MRDAPPSDPKPGGRPFVGRPGRRRAWWLAGAVAASLLALLGAGLALDSNPARAWLGSRLRAAVAARIPAARLLGDVRLDSALRLVAGPVVVDSRSAGAPPVLHVERVIVQPRLRALLAGRVEAAEIALDGVRLDARGGLAHLTSALSPGRPTVQALPGPGPAPRVTFRRAVVALPLRADPTVSGGDEAATATLVEVGPLSGSLRLARSADGAAVHATVHLPGSGHVDVSLRWAGEAAAATLAVRGLEAAAVPGALRSRLPFQVERGTLDLDVEAATRSSTPIHLQDLLSGTGIAASGKARFRAAARDLAARSATLGPDAVGPLDLKVAGALRWDAAAGRVLVDEARVDLGDSGRAGAAFQAALSARPEPRIELEIRTDDLDWEAAIASLPPALAPPREVPAVRGTLRATLSASGPLHDPAAWLIAGAIDPAGLQPASPRPGALDAARSFTWLAPPLPDGGMRAVVVGPENPDFVPLGELPAFVVRAVVLSEDAAFFVHHGFDVSEVQDALAHARERRRVRGASTISQQLAKNLFLSPERTLARKAREALATIALEASVDKRRLLEVYLNLAEWGPGVFGIGEAARHWFGKDPRALTPKEAAFLATVIPNPVRYELYRRRGALTELWEDRVRALLLKMRAAEVISDDQFVEAWHAALGFAGPA
jgi:hypothetical protein